MRKLWIVILLFGLCACQRPSDLILIEGKALPLEEVRYVLAAAGAQLVEGNELFDWDSVIRGISARDYVRQQAITIAVSARAVEAKAKELGVELSPEENAAIDRYIEQSAGQEGEEGALDALIKDVYGTADIYRFYGYTIPYLSEKLSQTLFGPGGTYAPEQETLRQFYQEYYTNVSYVLISATDPDGNPLTGEERDIQLAVAEAVQRKAASGEEFISLVIEHGQDYAMSLSPEGMPVARGNYEEAFDLAAEALAPGEISGVVDGQYGFYVIKRLEDNPDYFTENEDTIREQYISNQYAELLAQWSQAISCETTQMFDVLDPKEYYRQV